MRQCGDRQCTPKKARKCACQRSFDHLAILFQQAIARCSRRVPAALYPPPQRGKQVSSVSGFQYELLLAVPLSSTKRLSSADIVISNPTAHDESGSPTGLLPNTCCIAHKISRVMDERSPRNGTRQQAVRYCQSGRTGTPHAAATHRHRQMHQFPRSRAAQLSRVCDQMSTPK